MTVITRINRGRRPSALVLACAVLMFVTACGSSGSGDDLVSTLPENGELGDGWVRDGSPRSGDGEAATLCGVNLSNGMREGAKLDLAHPSDGSASSYHRRYDDAASARKAFAGARSQLAPCPEPGLAVGAKGRPGSGDEAFFVVLTPGDVDQALVGWTIVRTGADIRSLLLSPTAASPAAALSRQMERLSQALATT